MDWLIFGCAGSSWIRVETHVSCTGRQILNHWAPRGSPGENLGSHQHSVCESKKRRHKGIKKRYRDRKVILKKSRKDGGRADKVCYEEWVWGKGRKGKEWEKTVDNPRKGRGGQWAKESEKGPVSPSGAQGPNGVDAQFGNESICFALCDSFSPAGLKCPGIRVKKQVAPLSSFVRCKCYSE